jgi:hypothetical protein
MMLWLVHLDKQRTAVLHCLDGGTPLFLTLGRHHVDARHYRVSVLTEERRKRIDRSHWKKQDISASKDVHLR